MEKNAVPNPGNECLSKFADNLELHAAIDKIVKHQESNLLSGTSTYILLFDRDFVVFPHVLTSFLLANYCNFCMPTIS